MFDLAIVNGSVYFDKKLHKTNVYINDGIIVNISPLLLKSTEVYDCEGDLVLPGIIDPHTHFQLHLGKITSRDDFLYGTKAAAFGGVTTIIDFINPVNNAEALEESFYKRVRQARRSVVDYKLHACLKNPKGNIPEITKKMNDLGLNSVKIFTTYSDSNRRTYDPEIIELLKASKAQDFLVTAHIENDDMIQHNRNAFYYELPEIRPTISETSEALKLAKYAKETDGNLYMVHLSSGETIKRLRNQYSDILNKNFIVESCPHYFNFDKSILHTKEGYLYTMAPPLRDISEVELLRSHIDSIYTIGTDHCVFNKKEKHQLLLKDVPLGVGGVEHSFSVMFAMFGPKIIDKMTINVAKAHKLFPQKGIIAEGSDADMFIYHMKNTKITKSHGFVDYTIYKNTNVKGEVVSTISRGKFIVKNQIFINRKGELLNEGKNQNVKD